MHDLSTTTTNCCCVAAVLLKATTAAAGRPIPPPSRHSLTHSLTPTCSACLTWAMSGMNLKWMPCRPVVSLGVVNTSYTLSMVTHSTLLSRARRGFSSLICGWTAAGQGGRQGREGSRAGRAAGQGRAAGAPPVAAQGHGQHAWVGAGTAHQAGGMIPHCWAITRLRAKGLGLRSVSCVHTPSCWLTD